MTKARDIASAAPAPSTVSATELGYLDGVTSAIQTQLDAKTAKSTLTTTGDIYYASAANTPARLAIGSTSDVLTVAGGIPSWAAPAGGASFAGVYLNASGSQTLTNNTNTKIAWNNEVYDVGGYASGGDTITIPSGKAGYYLISSQIYWNQNATGYRGLFIKKNTTTTLMQTYQYLTSATPYPYNLTNITVYLDVGDTIAAYGQQTSGGNLVVYLDASDTFLTLHYLGA